MYVCIFFSVHIAWPLKPDQQLCFPSPEPPWAHGRSMLGTAPAPFPCLPPFLPPTPAGWPRPARSRSYDAVLRRTGGGGLSPAEHLLSIPLECRQISWHKRLSVMVPAEGRAASCPRSSLNTEACTLFHSSLFLSEHRLCLTLFGRYCICVSCSGFLHNPGARGTPLLSKCPG